MAVPFLHEINMQVGVSTPIPADMQSAGIGPSDSALPPYN